MRVGISFLRINRYLGGNFQYAINMLHDLSQAGGGNELVIFFDDNSLLNEPAMRVPNAEYVRVGEEKPNIIRKLWRLTVGLSAIQIGRSWAKGRYAVLDHSGCDVIFHPYWGSSAYLTETPSIAAIHDCAPRDAPETMSWRSRTNLDILIRSIARNARFILADSEHGRNLIEKYYRVESERIVVLPFRPPKYLISQPVNDAAVILEKYNIGSGYLFLPGRWGSYKNTERVLEALKLIRVMGLVAPKLVLCGIGDEELPLAKKAISRLGLQDHVHVLGFVPDEDMASLYLGAMVLIFPTLLGPTSIPVYEAMALGCPVIVSNISGYPEQVGDAGLLVDPLSVQSITDGILQVVNDPQLLEKLKEKGKKRMESAYSLNQGEVLIRLAEKVAR